MISVLSISLSLLFTLVAPVKISITRIQRVKISQDITRSLMVQDMFIVELITLDYLVKISITIILKLATKMGIILLIITWTFCNMTTIAASHIILSCAGVEGQLRRIAGINISAGDDRPTG